MTVLRTQRTYPLTLTADALNASAAHGYEWRYESGGSGGNGADHIGSLTWSAPGAAATVVTTSVGQALDPSVARTNNANFWMMGGTTSMLPAGGGDWTIWRRMRAPSVILGNNAASPIGRHGDSGNASVIAWDWQDVAATGGLHPEVVFGGAGSLNWTHTSTAPLAANAVVDVHITYSAGSVKCYVNGVLKVTISTTVSIGSYTGSDYVGVLGNAIDVCQIDELIWHRQLSDAEVTAHAANPYSYYANSAPPDSITVTTPAASATVGTSFAIIGTYAGGTTPTLVEASFNGGSYATIDAAPAAGIFGGTLSGQTPGTGTLSVRSKNGATVVATTTVTGVTVSANGIALDSTASPTNVSAVPYRMFQRDALNQASVRIRGTYFGTVTSIEYRHAGGAWATLVASPAGGTFDQTVTLQGPAYGDLEVRFSNLTAVTASHPGIGVGDVFMVLGQSNNVGGSAIYVPFVAPGAHPTWAANEFDKAELWRLNVETVGQPFDSCTSSVYGVHATTGQGSYFGKLASLIAEAGMPVAFVPCALGSTAIADWAVSTSTGTLYGAALARANTIGAHKGVVWYQGEEDGLRTTSQATYEAALNALINDWVSRFAGHKWVLCNINSTAIGAGFAAIHAAIAAVAASNANVGGIADMNGAFGGGGSAHYQTAPEITEVATRAFAAFNTAFNYASSVSTFNPPATAGMRHLGGNFQG